MPISPFQAPPTTTAPAPVNDPNNRGLYNSTVGARYGGGAAPTEIARAGGSYGGNDQATENTLRGSWLAGRVGGSMGGMNNELDRVWQSYLRGQALTGRGGEAQKDMTAIGTDQMHQGDQYTDVSGGYVNNAAQDARFQNTDRAGAQGSLDRLRAFYQGGPGPSAAQDQLVRAGLTGQAQTTALARSTRGAVDPMAMRNAAFMNAGAGQQTNQQMGVLKAQEAADWRNQQQTAMGMEQQGLNNIRGQDLSAMGGNVQGSLGYGNMGAGYSSLGSNTVNQGQQVGLGYSGTAESAAENAARMRNAILLGQSTADVSQYNAALGQSTGMNEINAQGRAATMGAIGSGGGSLANTVFGQRKPEDPYAP